MDFIDSFFFFLSALDCFNLYTLDAVKGYTWYIKFLLHLAMKFSTHPLKNLTNEPVVEAPEKSVADFAFNSSSNISHFPQRLQSCVSGLSLTFGQSADAPSVASVASVAKTNNHFPIGNWNWLLATFSHFHILQFLSGFNWKLKMENWKLRSCFRNETFTRAEARLLNFPFSILNFQFLASATPQFSIFNSPFSIIHHFSSCSEEWIHLHLFSLELGLADVAAADECCQCCHCCQYQQPLPNW